MKEVNIYTKTSMKGMKAQDGKAVYVISMLLGDREVTKSVDLDLIAMTPNAAELKVIIEALKRFNQGCKLHIYTDSSYVTGYYDWLPKWKAKGYKNAKGEPVANVELWKELDKLLKKHEVTWHLMESHPYRKWLEAEIKRLKPELEDILRNKPSDAAV